MKTIVLGLALALTAGSALAQTHVKGYYRSNGTYVQPHYRSAPNNTKLDNYSTQGNVNPYTGRQGTVNPYPNSGGYYQPQQPVYAPSQPAAQQQDPYGFDEQ
ncbi:MULTISPECIES: hypothetical protein [unclassified Xanthomonas]|uniref:hypothetical protein n=1 Tax=unclassified Xanthomonas TaxID=2643310 RepID=UPI00186B2187|nr:MULTISPECIES: hypothetical protein [unclassified Xanthomonas]